jgi:hypothetical protein
VEGDVGPSCAVEVAESSFAKSYSVILKQHGGGVRTLRVKSNAHSVRLASIPGTVAGTVEVIASGPLGDKGRAGKTSFKALSKEQTRLLSFKELGNGTPFVQHKVSNKKRH